MEKNFLPNGPAYLSRASHQRCGPAASRTARPRCVRGSRGVSPQDDIEILPRMGLPAPFPGSGDRELDTRPRMRSVSVLGFEWGTESHDNGQT